MLDVQADAVGGLTEADVELLQSIANQVAIALQNARAYQRKIRSLTAIYRVGGFHPGLKAALAALGICQPTVTSPMAALDAGQIKAVAAKLETLGLL